MTTFISLSEIENLRLFVQERAQAFDATIETQIGSTFDIEVVQPLIDRLSPDPFNTPLRRFILERLAKEFPDLVLQDGEVRERGTHGELLAASGLYAGAWRRQSEAESLEGLEEDR